VRTVLASGLQTACQAVVCGTMCLQAAFIVAGEVEFFVMYIEIFLTNQVVTKF